MCQVAGRAWAGKVVPELSCGEAAVIGPCWTTPLGGFVDVDFETGALSCVVICGGIRIPCIALKEIFTENRNRQKYI